LVLAVLILAPAYVYLRQSLPLVEGEAPAPGLSAPVDIVRDPYGIPHIYASGDADAAYALGYAHAQDRLWQMEMNRRIGSGRLAEILGPAALDTDRFLRTLGVRRPPRRPSRGWTANRMPCCRPMPQASMHLSLATRCCRWTFC